MKLLFDANLSRHIMVHVEDLFPASAHVSALGPAPEDIEIWRFAAANGFIVATKDSDFYRISMTWGIPPEVMWLRMGNAGTRVVADTCVPGRSAGALRAGVAGVARRTGWTRVPFSSHAIPDIRAAARIPGTHGIGNVVS